jgi:hypothetical protein
LTARAEKPDSSLTSRSTADGRAGRVVDVGPAARQGPQSIATLAHQQDLVVAKDAGAHIDLGRRVALLALEEAAQVIRLGLRARGQHLGGDLAHLLVALAVVLLLAEGQPGLGDGLQLAAPA